MGKAKGGSTVPTVGPGRGEDKHNYPRPQVEAYDDIDH
jgi:hypothetical protein